MTVTSTAVGFSGFPVRGEVPGTAEETSCLCERTFHEVTEGFQQGINHSPGRADNLWSYRPPGADGLDRGFFHLLPWGDDPDWPDLEGLLWAALASDADGTSFHPRPVC